MYAYTAVRKRILCIQDNLLWYKTPGRPNMSSSVTFFAGRLENGEHISAPIKYLFGVADNNSLTMYLIVIKSILLNNNITYFDGVQIRYIILFLANRR